MVCEFVAPHHAAAQCESRGEKTAGSLPKYSIGSARSRYAIPHTQQGATKPQCPISQVSPCAGQEGLPGNLPAGQAKMSPSDSKMYTFSDSHYDISTLSEDDFLLSFTLSEQGTEK